MRIILRVFLVTFLSLILTLFVASHGAPDCLRLANVDFVQYVDIKTNKALPVPPADVNDSYSKKYYTTSPDKQYQGTFHRARQVGEDVTLYDFQVAPADEQGNLTGIPHVLYRDLPEPYDVGADYRREIVDSVWFPDSRHILLYWMPDYYTNRYYVGSDLSNMTVTQSRHQFAVVDLAGNIIAQYTLSLPLINPNVVQPHGIQPFSTIVIEGISSDGNVVALRYDDGTHEVVRMLSLIDFQPVAPDIALFAGGCYSGYESGDRHCVNWSPQDSVLSVIGKQSDGNPVVVIQDITRGQRHTIPLPVAPYAYFLLISWSPDGEHDIVSWFYNRIATQLVFDRSGNTLAILPNTGTDYVPLHTWTADGSGVLYYEQRPNFDYIGNLYLTKTRQLITFPGNLVNQPWFNERAWRGSNIAVVWNEPQPANGIAVKLGILDTTTGKLTTLRTFTDHWIAQNEPVTAFWLSDTRLAISATFTFAWGNIDGSDWHEASEPLNVDPASVTPDGKSMLVVKPSETPPGLYELNLETGSVQLSLSSSGALQSVKSTGRSPSGRYIYRLFSEMTPVTITELQIADTRTGHSYTIDDGAKPLWSSDEEQIMVMTSNGQLHRLRLFSTATGDLLRETTRQPADWEWAVMDTSFGRCS